MATTNKDFVVKQGLKVATGVTFPDNTVQTTAFTGSSNLPVYSSDPGSPSNGQQYINSVSKRVKVYYDGIWYTQAFFDDTASVTDHTHNTEGFVDSIYEYQGNGPEGLWLGTSLDGGSPSTTSFSMVIDGGAA